MHNQVLRLTHQVITNTHPEIRLATLPEALIYFVISFGVVAISAVLYLKKSSQSHTYILPISPSESQQLFIFVTVILIIGGVGGYSAINKIWHDQTWQLYALCNFMLAFYIYIYQSQNKNRLINATVLMAGIAAIYFWFFKRLVEDDHQKWILFTMGAVQAWAFLWCFYAMGQLFVYQCGMRKKVQTIVFFIATVGILALVTLRHAHHKASWSDKAGFLASGGSLLFLMLIRSIISTQ